PKSLTYFEDQFLRIAHSPVYGDLKKQFTKLAEESRSTDISTVFFPAEMSVDPVALTSEVAGELHAYVGNTRVSRERRRYRLTWHYAGLRLSLLAFEDISLEEAKG
ncbi:MAG: TraE/TraK family type IV conjugative transfer system protein, partial [bacterium]